MEDVLDVYTRPRDPARPLVCLDETSRQVLAEVRPPLPAAPGRPRREDPEYAREGMVNLVLVCEPLRGWREVRVSNQRTRLNWAAGVKELVDTHYPTAERIVLVMDQLNGIVRISGRRTTWVAPQGTVVGHRGQCRVVADAALYRGERREVLARSTAGSPTDRNR